MGADFYGKTTLIVELEDSDSTGFAVNLRSFFPTLGQVGDEKRSVPTRPVFLQT